MSKILRLDTYYYANRHSMMLVNTHIRTVEDLTTIALLTYGIFITTNDLRKQQRQQNEPLYKPAQPQAPTTSSNGSDHYFLDDLPPPTPAGQSHAHPDNHTRGTYIYDMLVQNIGNGAMGHHKSTYILGTRWLTNPPRTPIPPLRPSKPTT